MLNPITHLYSPKHADISVFTSGVSVTATWPFWDISAPFQTSLSYNANTLPIFLPCRENFSCSGDLKSSFCPYCRHTALKTQMTMIHPVSFSQDFISAAPHTKMKPERTQKLNECNNHIYSFLLTVTSKILHVCKNIIMNFYTVQAILVYKTIIFKQSQEKLNKWKTKYWDDTDIQLFWTASANSLVAFFCCFKNANN